MGEIPLLTREQEISLNDMTDEELTEWYNSIDEIPQKVENILNDYNSYKEQALMAFRRFYDFDENFKKFILDFDAFLKNESRVEIRNKEIYTGE